MLYTVLCVMCHIQHIIQLLINQEMYYFLYVSLFLSLSESSERYSLASFQRYALNSIYCQHFVCIISRQYCFVCSCLQSSRTQCSAEDLAHRLVSEFRKQWFSSELLKNPVNLNSALQEVRMVTLTHIYIVNTHRCSHRRPSLFH